LKGENRDRNSFSKREQEMSEPIEIAKKWLNAMNEHDVDQMSAADPPPAEGRDQIANSYRGLFAGFPDSRAEILNIFSGQGQVLAEVRWSGTNKADFRGTPATGKFVDVRIAYIFKIEGGNIRRITEYYDGAAVANQMGLS
jgi:steroid delta-isomerase-like uncharacterized protein